ncbi:hypothetical protein ACIPVB_08960 [Microbacterium sp. NPDC090007]|uniref:hypothetical protein n=1 Tax=Microbacterium sp. NPDC090007 TaxID=3364204 RepID=UPI0037FE6C31
MSLNLKYEDVQPFLPALPPAQALRAQAWVPVLDRLLNARYGAHIDTHDDTEQNPSNRVMFVSAAADALERRLGKPAGPIDSQSVGPASVKYNTRAALSRWFLPEELDQLDEVCGLGGGIRSVRAPVPNAVRFGNTMSVFDQIAESDGYVRGDD